MSFASTFLQFDSLFSSKQLDLQLRLKEKVSLDWLEDEVLVEKTANHLPNMTDRENIKSFHCYSQLQENRCN